MGNMNKSGNITANPYYLVTYRLRSPPLRWCHKDPNYTTQKRTYAGVGYTFFPLL